MPEVKFEITGLVACYRKPDDSEFWTFVFPSDGHHTAEFSYVKEEVPDQPKNPSIGKRNVTISSTDSVAPAEYSTQRFRDHVLDITAEYLHRDGVSKRQNYKKMMVKHAILDSKHERDNFAIAMQFDTPNRPPTGMHLITNPLSDLIGGTIEIPPNGKVVIEIDGENPIELSAGDSFAINNYCGGCQRDFLKYYKLLKNKGSNSKKTCDVLSIRKFDLDDEGNPLILDEKKSLEKILGEPPAFCDGVRIGGDTGGLD